jgi:MFS family permease
MNATEKAWAVTVVAYLASVAVSANRFKVPPVLDIVMADLHADMVTGGWFMSIYAVAGLVLALPAAFLLLRLGLKVTGLVALGCAVAGSVGGALAADASTLLVGRVLEGVGGGLISVAAPAAISAWFAPRDRGLPMGVWTTWVPVGNVLMFNAAHPLLESLGWQAVWWFGALLGAAAFVVYGLVVAAPPAMASGTDVQPTWNRVREPRQAIPNLLNRQHSFSRALLNPVTWLLALAFAALAFSLLAYSTWAPAYLTEMLQIDTARASFYASLMFLAGIPGNLFAGWVMVRTKHRYGWLTLGFLVTGSLFFWSFRLGSELAVVPYMFVLGFAANFIPTAVLTLAPTTMPSRRLAALGLAIVTAGSNVGVLLGPPALAAVLRGGGWASGSVCLVLVVGLGLIATLLARSNMLQRGLASEPQRVPEHR